MYNASEIQHFEIISVLIFASRIERNFVYIENIPHKMQHASFLYFFFFSTKFGIKIALYIFLSKVSNKKKFFFNGDKWCKEKDYNALIFILQQFYT